jgi:parallel beta-helix repeat protein
MMLSILLYFSEEVEAQTTDYIQIRSAPGGGGINLSDPANYLSLPVGTVKTFYGAAYNNSVGYIGNVGETAAWISSDPSIVNVTTTGNFSTVTCSDTNWGTVTITLDDGFGYMNTTQVTVLQPTTDHILIRDAPAGGGNNLCHPLNYPTYPMGYATTFYGAAYNITAGYIGEVPASSTWSSSDSLIVSTTTPGSSSTITCSNSNSGTATITLDDGMGHTNFTQVTVPDSPDFILIRDAPGGMGINLSDPANYPTYPFGAEDVFYGALYNQTAGYLGDVPTSSTWDSSNSLIVGVTSPGASAIINCSESFEGSSTITLDDGAGHITTTVVTVANISYTVDYIIIQDSPWEYGNFISPRYYPLWSTDIFYAVGYNNSGGYIGEVSVNWSSSNSSVGTVTTPGSSTTFNTVGYGTCNVTAEYGVGITNTTGALTVAPVNYILIRDQPDNRGLEVGDEFFYEPQNYTLYYAAGYNFTYGYLGDVNATWISSNITVGTVTSPGTSTQFNAWADGTCVVSADFNSNTDDTGTLTVSSYSVDFIQIRDAPGGGGNVVVDPSYARGTEDIYYGAMYSNIVGYLADVPYYSNWESSHSYIVSVTDVGTSTTIFCNETFTGTANITLWAASVFNSTFVTVLNWTVDYISIRDAPGAFGNVIGATTYSVWDTDLFYAIALNYTEGYVMDVNVSWSSDNVNVGTVTTPGTSTLFSAQWVLTDDTCIVTATFDTFSNSTDVLTVLSPRTDFVQIRSAEGGGGSIITNINYYKGDTDIYYGAAYNNTVDFIDSVPLSSTWTSSDPSIVDVSSPGNSSAITCSNTNGGTVTVTLDDGLGNSNSSTVTVLNWTVDYILIRDAPVGGGRDLSDPANYGTYPVGYITTYYGAMYNNSEGYIADVGSTSTWTSDDTSIVALTSPGVSSTISCSNTNHGTVTITLEEVLMGKSTTTQITVLEPTLDYITIMDAANGIGNIVGNMLYFIGVEDDFYAAAFNNTAEYLYDVSVEWSSSDTSVGTITTPGSQTNFTAVGIGTCVVTAQYSSMISDSTGTLTVDLPSNITVGQCPGAYFTSIQEAVTYANEGNTIYVCSGTYYEHLTIDKSLTIIGEDMATTIIDGEDYGKVIFVTSDDVSISGFKIQNGEYGIYLEETGSTSVIHNKIRDYDYGIYCYKSIDGYIAHNIITDGKYGIVTFEAYNDAIRYNTISFNSEYGAKDYNSQLRNCFNWNYFFKNKIAYYYDPDTELDILEFDGNILEDNYIGIKVENASTISITNNTASGNDYGIYLVNASPEIAQNEISDSVYGIYADHSSPSIFNNIISEISQYGIYAQSGDSLKIINNTMLNAQMIFIDSIIKEIWLKETHITRINTTLEDSHLDETSSFEIEWLLQIQIIDEEGNPVEDATVLIYDAHDTLISAHFTDSEGWVRSIPVVELKQSASFTRVYNPYHILVIKGPLSNAETVTIQDDTEMVISLKGEDAAVPTKAGFPWALVIMVGFIGAIGIGSLAFEVTKYGLIALFLPLYSRIKKEKVLDQPTRYKIYGYIIGNPGAHFGLIKDDLDLGSGQLVYHLQQLVEAHMIYSREDGVKKRFYPADTPQPKSDSPNFSETQEKILGIIKKNSGIGQKKIASDMGISRQVAEYHLTKMERKGLINKEVEGRETKYYPSENFSV